MVWARSVRSGGQGRFRIFPVSQSDVADIWNYTAETWGPDQAEAYVRRVKRATQAIATDYQLGRAGEENRSGDWKYLVGSHVLFYRIDLDSIDVIRILHSLGDFELHP